MKLYLSVNKQGPTNFTHINLATYAIDVNSLNGLCEPAECTEMVLDDVLSYINLQQIPEFLGALVTRLRKRGTIKIINPDVQTLTQGYLNGQLSIADFNILMFGNAGVTKCACCSCVDIQHVLTSRGLTIESIDLIAGQFIIIAKRT